MDEQSENRFGYLRELTTDEKLQKIEELENENKWYREIIEDKYASSDNKSELYNDIKYNNELIKYLNTILEEKKL